ncbi:aldo/keto reductase [Enterocloster asparagiformis]|uniref:aldo/keto reductase n=1 Tax=Enterocloster asparagiformis TaxID=333367 RepID=UPI000466BE19|nr:aldo/keto reductase [Enterocloster asparagiformis]
MKYHILGKSDINASVLGMGCWAYGGGDYWGAQSQRDVEAVVRQALDLGINFFDTAEMYNDGASERSLGQALHEVRHKAVIASKIGPAFCRDIRAHLEGSLRRLGTDYLDVYMLHWPINDAGIKHFTADPEILKNPPTIEDACSQLIRLKEEGLIRSIGVSNFGVKQIAEILACGIEVDVNEMPYNLVSRAIEEKIVPFCLENQISLIGSMALQQGLLAGIYETVEQVPAHQAHSRHFSQMRGGEQARHGEEGAENEVFEVVALLKSLAEQMGISCAQLALAWILNKPFMHCTLVGSRNTRELFSNIQACELTLPQDVIDKLDAASLPVLQKLGDSPDYYENRNNSRIY